MKMRPCLIVLVVLSAVYSGTGSKNAAMGLTVIPSAAVALINDSTFLNCSTTSVNVEWLFGSDQYSELFIYSYGTVKPTYVDRFRVENYANSLGNHFNLIFQYMSKNDAGLYICRDPDNPNQEGKVHLTVLETQPVCKSNLNVDGLIGPNSCSIKPDIVLLSCSVRYIGNRAPELQWTKNGEDITIINSSKCSFSGNIKTCNLTMETELQMEGDYYTCQTTQSRTNQHYCTSDVFRIIYVLGEDTELTRTVDEKVNCSVNSSSQSCNLTWIFDNGTTNWTESHEPVIEFKRPGRFICQADCVIGNKNCTFSAMTVNVSANAESPENANATVEIFVGLSVAFISIVIIVCLITFFYLRNKKRQKRQAFAGDPHRHGPLEKEELLNRVNAGDLERRRLEEIELQKREEAERQRREEEEQQKLHGLIATIRTNSAEEMKKPIHGLTILDNELFVASKESSEVEVYDSANFSFSRQWTLKELIDPEDIVSCNINKCLYISDYKVIDLSKAIFSVDLNGKLIKKWLTKIDFGRLSVTYDSNVILVSFSENKLNEYSSDGQLIREIYLSSDEGLCHPRHAIKLTNGHFVISHGSVAKGDEDDLHRVCIVNADGKLLKSFGGERGSTIKQTNDPEHLCVDGNGYVMVADYYNSRVLLLDSNLEFNKEILSNNHGLRAPDSILLDESNSRLFVSDNVKDINNYRILIFDLGLGLQN